MTITPACVPLTVYQYATFNQLIQFTNPDGSLIDFTGLTLRMQARQEDYSSATFIDLSTENGGIVVLLTPKGAWDASTNTPPLADGTGTSGDIYTVSVAGTQNLGSGDQVFAVGDYVQYNGTIWVKVPQFQIDGSRTPLYNVQLLISAAATGAIAVQSGFYDLVVSNPAATPPTEDRYLQGAITISLGVTQ